MKIKKGEILAENKFSLFETSNDGIVLERTYKGCWVLCDNGYQNWPVLIAPMKDAVLYKDLRWSKWVESIRKDVECTFGILKGRFRILKIGIRVQSIEAVDNLWCTCCALHNMFLDADGLNETWETVTASDWVGELGMHSAVDVTDTAFDISGMGFGSDHTIDDEGTNDDNVDGSEIDNYFNNNNNINDHSNTSEIGIVHEMHHGVFRQKLVDHFDILFQRQQIHWPTRNGLQVPDI
jgi:Plant transposon protein